MIKTNGLRVLNGGYKLLNVIILSLPLILTNITYLLFWVAELALSPNNHEVHIHHFQGGQWIRTAILDEHAQRVTGIDWASRSNNIVTCGAVSRQFLC